MLHLLCTDYNSVAEQQAVQNIIKEKLRNDRFAHQVINICSFLYLEAPNITKPLANSLTLF